MTKFVSVNKMNSKKEVYHTNTECKRIRSDVRVVPESEIEYHKLTLCAWCDPSVDNPNAQYDQDRSYYQALKEAAQND
jgi:hypothetical protein